jgi:hypothetical protein
VQSLSAPTHDDDEVRRFEDRQVFGDRLARHVEAGAQLTEVLTASLIQTVKELAATRISECFEHFIHRRQPPRASAS